MLGDPVRHSRTDRAFDFGLLLLLASTTLAALASFARF